VQRFWVLEFGGQSRREGLKVWTRSVGPVKSGSRHGDLGKQNVDVSGPLHESRGECRLEFLGPSLVRRPLNWAQNDQAGSQLAFSLQGFWELDTKIWSVRLTN